MSSNGIDSYCSKFNDEVDLYNHFKEDKNKVFISNLMNYGLNLDNSIQDRIYDLLNFKISSSDEIDKIFDIIGDKFNYFKINDNSNLLKYKLKILDLKGEKFNYYICGNHTIYIKIGDKYGILFKDGNYTDIKYDDINNFKISEGIPNFYKVRIGNKYGLLDNMYNSGNEITEIKYDSIELDGKYIKVSNGGKYGLLNYGGQEIIECKYNSNIREYKYSNHFLVYDLNKYKLIGIEGEIYKEGTMEEIEEYFNLPF